jgi:hydrogenase maturation protease
VSPVAPRAVVIGIGNRDGGDDAAGPALLARLRGRMPPDIGLIEQSGEATTLLDTLACAADAYLIDACRSGCLPGTIHRFDALARPLPRIHRECSTHGFGIADGIELARVLGVLPRHCLVYCIEGASYQPGAPLSAPVLAALETLAARLLTDLGQRSAAAARGAADSLPVRHRCERPS